MTVQLPAHLLDMPIEQLDNMLCRASVAVWAEKRRGFNNAPFHLEWYSLMATERRLALIAPRDHSKTECVTVNGSTHAAIYRPGIWSYIFAATADLAVALKARIDAAVLEAAPELRYRQPVDTKIESVYSNGSRITVAGVGKAVRGAHPDIICGDDVLDEESTATEYQRRKIDRWWRGTVSPMAHPGIVRIVPNLGRVRFPPSQIRLVGTPFHSQDLLMSLRNSPIYTWRRYAAEFHPDQLVPGTYAVEARNG